MKETIIRDDVQHFYDSPEDSAVAECEAKYPTLTKTFKDIQQHQYETFCRKHLDYGLTNIAVGTTLETEDERHLSVTGIWFRMNDKIQRLRNILFNRNTGPINESIDDSLVDLSVYGIITLIVRAGKWKKD